MSTPYYIPKNFAPWEFVPPDVYKMLGDNCLIVMDNRILQTADAIREHFDVPMTINNWKTGGGFSQRGFRNADNVGAKFSQHRYGRAIDFDIKGINADDVRKEILSMQSAESFQYITGMEINISWVHVDCRNIYHENGIITFNP